MLSQALRAIAARQKRVATESEHQVDAEYRGRLAGDRQPPEPDQGAKAQDAKLGVEIRAWQSSGAVTICGFHRRRSSPRLGPFSLENESVPDAFTPDVPDRRRCRSLALFIGGAAWLMRWDCPRAADGRIAQVGGPFSLVSQDGKRVTEKDFLGHYTLVFFGYTFCPDVCPTELQVMTAALEQMGDQGKNIQPVFVTIDPERDTPKPSRPMSRILDPASWDSPARPKRWVKPPRPTASFTKRPFRAIPRTI